MNYTTNHHLPQWVSSDRVRMEDFNDAMANIESGLSANADAASDALSTAQAAAEAIAGLVPDSELSEDNIMPEAFDPRVAEVVAEAVKSHIVK